MNAANHSGEFEGFRDGATGKPAKKVPLEPSKVRVPREFYIRQTSQVGVARELYIRQISQVGMARELYIR